MTASNCRTSPPSTCSRTTPAPTTCAATTVATPRWPIASASGSCSKPDLARQPRLGARSSVTTPRAARAGQSQGRRPDARDPRRVPDAAHADASSAATSARAATAIASTGDERRPRRATTTPNRSATFAEAGVDLVVRVHDELRGRGDRRDAGGARRRCTRRDLVHAGDRRPAAEWRLAAGSDRADRRRDRRLSGPLHDQLRASDALRLRARTPARPGLQRIGGLRANASRRSHAELDEAPDLDAGDPDELGNEYRLLEPLLPGLSVVGGCCGTDHRHVAAICSALAAARRALPESQAA